MNTKTFQPISPNPEIRKRIAWSYIDARDLGQIVKLCIEKDGLGFQVFNAANDTVSANTPSRELAARYFPNVPFTPRDRRLRGAAFQPEDP